MAMAVAAAITARQSMICEAGTGIGKTFAYLVPVLLSGRRVLISTATKTLQDQLFFNDLPRVQRALGTTHELALLKGRSNYVCRYRLARAAQEPDLWHEAQSQIAEVETWARATTRGDIAEVRAIPEDSGIWPRVTSTVDNCLGQACPDFAECFVVKARRTAAAADLVVINHHLLFADLALREEGFGEILPTVEVVIVDEAHQLPELAAQAFGQAVSGRQLRDLAHASQRAAINEAPDMPSLRDATRGLESAIAAAYTHFGAEPGRYERPDEPGAAVTLALSSALHALVQNLEPAAPRGAELETCLRRAESFLARVTAFDGAAAEDAVRWVDATARGFVLHTTPLSIAEQFQSRLARHAASWIFCSATLSVDGDFAHFQRELGLSALATASWDSPFDFARQALLYLPRIAAAPNSADYLDAVVTTAIEVIDAARGRTFLLCTSYRALSHCAAPLRARLSFPVLVQGEAPRAALLAQFKALGNAVLIATATFWEGVDVRGDALSCVIIDKLPFAPPDEPILKARVRRMQAEGQNAFRGYQVPAAALQLKQGAGRLIRDVSDRGVLVLCDPRLTSRSYGKTFLRALPALPRTSEIAAVRAFFADTSSTSTSEKSGA